MPLVSQGRSACVADRVLLSGDPPKRQVLWRLIAIGSAMVVCLAITSGALALDTAKNLSQYTIDIWKNGQGLPVNSVTTVAQTADGYLWLGTQSGLVRFDGIGSRSFNRRNTPSLASSIVWSLLGLSTGELWIGLEDAGVVVLNSGRFEPLAVVELAESTVMALHEDSMGGVWIGTEAGHVYRYFGGECRLVSPPTGLGGSVRDFEAEGTSEVWVAAEGTGVWRLDAEDGIRRNLTLQDGLPTDVVISLGRDPDGALWIGTHAEGAAQVTGSGVIVRSVDHGLAHNTVNEIVSDSDGNLWFATQQGLSRMSPAGEFATLAVLQDLGASVVRSVVEDREGSLWVGTGGGGLCRLKDSPVTTFAAREGLAFDHVWTVLEDSADDIWIGSAGGGLFRMRGDEIRVVHSTANGLSNDTVLSLCETSDGTLWVGTRDGLNLIRDGKIQVLREQDGLPNTFVRVLAVDSHDRVWIGTRGGLARYEHGRLTVFDENDGLTSDVIRYVLEARDGTIWIGTNGGGINRLGKSGFSSLTSVDGLTAGYVFALHEDRSGTIWAGTNEGLNRIRNGRIESLTIEDGLPDDFIYRILEDEEDRLWMSTNAGIMAIPVSALNAAIDTGEPIEGIRSFGAADGMQNPECNGGVQPAGWKDHEGRMWFPTVQGISRIDPAGLRRNRVSPNVVIDRVVVDGDEISVNKHGSVRIEPGTTRFEVHFAALSLLDPAKVRYRYRLDGLESEWTDAGPRRTAYYTSVPPGRYRFQVTGCNNDGVWSTSAAELEFEIVPMFRQTGWMVLIYVAASVALIGVVFFVRIRQMRRRESRLVELVEERTAQLETANRRLEVLVNQDGLTGITNRRHFEQLLEHEWKRCVRNSQSISVILADIDDFKAFNDTYGHQSGDDCLQKIAQVLASEVRRPADVVARYGGEEFVALLPETDIEGAAAVAESMRRQVLSLEIPHKASRAHSWVSVSFGVAGTIPHVESRSDDLMELADEALYQAKEAGRNRTARSAWDAPDRKLKSI
ncbi:MAG: diguanylate cyclase [bacterium]|nr:diguanylate cyclase [bacterium]